MSVKIELLSILEIRYPKWEFASSTSPYAIILKFDLEMREPSIRPVSPMSPVLV
jgi:hypothetical protein